MGNKQSQLTYNQQEFIHQLNGQRFPTQSSNNNELREQLLQAQTIIAQQNSQLEQLNRGQQQYVDNLISKNGLDGLQIFEHDYHYYKMLNPAIKYVTVDTLEANKPLVIAMPFPGHLGIHREMVNILKICNEKNIDVHLDCAWLVSAFDIEFNFDQPCIKSFAMSFSKAYSLHWNKVGIRWSRETDLQDTVTILNNTGAVSRLTLYVAKQYMERFPIDYLCQKYNLIKYFKICRELKLRPSNIIHACFSIDRKFLYGLNNYFN